MEDSSVDFGDFFKGKLPQKFLFLLGWLVLSRVGTYIPLWGVDRSAFAGSLDQSSLLGTLDTFSGGSIGRLGVSSLGIVPYINAQIVVQLLGSVFPKLQELQKKEGEAGRKKVKRWTQYASVGFGIIQVGFCCPWGCTLSVSLTVPFSVTVDDDNLLVIDTDYFSREGLDCRLLVK
jgi:protein transport protein SEC61 subunit alpha